MQGLSDTAKRVLEECSQTKRSVYELSKILDIGRYAIAVQCKKLEKDDFLRSRLETKGRKRRYHSLGIAGLGYLFLTKPDEDQLVAIAKSNVDLLPEVFGSQFFTRHPELVCKLLSSVINEATDYTGVSQPERIPKEARSIYYRFVHRLVMLQLGESPFDENFVAEVLKDKIAATWWPMETGFLSVYLACFIQRADVLLKFQDEIAEGIRSAKTDPNTKLSLTTFTTLVEQLPAGFREFLAQRFGVDWEKFDFGIMPLRMFEFHPRTEILRKEKLRA